MNRTEKEQMIIGDISLLSNKLTQMGDEIFPDITYKQFFMLLVISKMELEEKSINSIAELVGTTRQNVKKTLTHLESKGYVVIRKSAVDSRALKIELTDKTFQYCLDNVGAVERKTNQVFKEFSIDEIDSLIGSLEKLMGCLSLQQERSSDNE